MPISVTFRRGRGRGPGIALSVTQGTGQSGTVGAVLGTTVKVRALTPSGVAIRGVAILCTPDSDGKVNGFGQPTVVYTDVNGYATIAWRLPTTAGTATLTVASASAGFSSAITATASADVAAILEAATVTDQAGTASGAVAVPPAVRVLDRFRNPRSGDTVTWAVVSGGGAIVGGGTTDANGLATVTSYTLGPSAGANSCTASVAGITGSVTFTASASSGTATHAIVFSGDNQSGIVAGQPSASVVYQFLDAGNNGVPSLTVQLSANFGTPSVSTAVTDANGKITVTLTTDTTVRAPALMVAQFAGISAVASISSTFGALAQLALEVEPDTNCVSGQPLPQQPVVRLLDANGNLRTTDTSTITANLIAGNGTLTGATKAAVAGRASYTALTLIDADGGTDRFQFTFGGLQVTAAAVTTPAPPVATKVRMVTQPSASFAAPSLLNAFSAEVTDASNVRIPGYSGLLTVTRQSGTGTLGGTLTVACVNGLATFGNVTYDTVENGVGLHIADPPGLLTAVNTSTFNVAAVGSSNRPANASTLIGSVTGWDNSAGELGASPPHAIAGITGLAYGTGNISKQTNPLTNLQRTRIRWPGPPNAQQAGVGNCAWAIWPNPEFASGGVRYGAMYVRFRQIVLWGNAGVDYENEGTGTKLTFSQTGVGANNNFLMLIGTGVDNALQTAMKIEWRQQAVVVNGTPAPPTSNRNVAQNNGFAGQALFTVGVPHDLEYYIECNTLASVNGTLGNGKLRLWLDGNLIITRDDMQFRNSTHSSHIGAHKWNSTWGGSGGAKTRDDDLYYEDVELYGDLTLQS